MHIIKKLGFYGLFFSLPLIATLKGKGILVSLFVAFFLFDGPQACVSMIKRPLSLKKWILSPSLKVGILCTVALFCVYVRNWESMFTLLRLVGLALIVAATSLGIQTQSADTRHHVTKVFLGGGLFYIGFFLWEIYGPAWASKCITDNTGFNVALFIRGTVILTFLAIPMLIAVDRFDSPKKTFAHIFILISLILILLKAQPSAARLSVIGGVFFFWLSYYHWKTIKLLFVLMGGWLLSAPFIFKYFINKNTLFKWMHYLPDSYQHRVQIWETFSNIALTRPFFGYGLGFRPLLNESEYGSPLCLFYGKESVNIMRSTTLPDGISYYDWGQRVCLNESVLTTHPHNGPLQIWLESGAYGALTFLFLIYFLYRVMNKLNTAYRPYTMAVIGMYFVYWNISFGMWQTWFLALVALTFLLFQIINGLPFKGKQS